MKYAIQIYMFFIDFGATSWSSFLGIPDKIQLQWFLKSSAPSVSSKEGNDDESKEQSI